MYVRSFHADEAKQNDDLGTQEMLHSLPPPPRSPMDTENSQNTESEMDRFDASDSNLPDVSTLIGGHIDTPSKSISVGNIDSQSKSVSVGDGDCDYRERTPDAFQDKRIREMSTNPIRDKRKHSRSAERPRLTLLQSVKSQEWKCVQLLESGNPALMYIIIDKVGIFERESRHLITKFKNIKTLWIGKGTENVIKNPWAVYKPHEMFFSIKRTRKFKGDKYFDFAVKDRRTRKCILYQILKQMADIGLVPRDKGVYQTKKAIKRIRKESEQRIMKLKFEPGVCEEKEERKQFIEKQRSKYLASKLMSVMTDMEKQRDSYEQEIEEVRRSSQEAIAALRRSSISSAATRVSSTYDPADTVDTIDEPEKGMRQMEMEKELAMVQANLDGAEEQKKLMQNRILALASELKAKESSRRRLSFDVTELEMLKEVLSKKEVECEEWADLHDKLEAEMIGKEVELADLRDKIKQKDAELRQQKSMLSTTQANALQKSQAEMEEKQREMQKYCQKVQRSFLKTQIVMKTLKKESSKDLREIGGMFNELKPKLEKVFTENPKMVDLRERYQKEWKLRRKYFNIVQDLRGNIRVFCRFRPLLPFELDKGFTECVQFPQGGKVKIGNVQGKLFEFEFDKVYTPEKTQEDVTKDTSEYIQSVMDGYNVSIFAYGQTGSGKTYTMNGPKDNPGVNLRALKHLFKIKEERSSQFEYKIEVSILEIYMEKIADLIEDGEEVIASETGQLTVKNTHLTATPNLSRASSFGGSSAQSSKGNSREFRVSRSKSGSVDIMGLTKIEVNSEDDIQKLNDLALRNRSSRATDMNEHSSRSHMLLCVYVNGENTLNGTTFESRLWLVDLAGSERVKKSGATGQSMKEAQNINKSLSALGDVIAALQKQEKFIPYRNSTLTNVMASALGGKAKTIMFINCCPATEHAFETINSLRFAERVGRVELGKAQNNMKTKRRRKPPPKKNRVLAN